MCVRFRRSARLRKRGKHSPLEIGGDYRWPTYGCRHVCASCCSGGGNARFAFCISQSTFCHGRADDGADFRISRTIRYRLAGRSNVPCPFFHLFTAVTCDALWTRAAPRPRTRYDRAVGRWLSRNRPPNRNVARPPLSQIVARVNLETRPTVTYRTRFIATIGKREQIGLFVEIGATISAYTIRSAYRKRVSY